MKQNKEKENYNGNLGSLAIERGSKRTAGESPADSLSNLKEATRQVRKRTELKLCKRCFTMKNIKINNLTCKRCEEETFTSKGTEKGTPLTPEIVSFGDTKSKSEDASSSAYGYGVKKMERITCINCGKLIFTAFDSERCDC